MNFVASVIACIAVSGCATPQPVVSPPEIIKVPDYRPLPPECAELPVVVLPERSSANDVMAEQKQALDEAMSTIQRCFKP